MDNFDLRKYLSENKGNLTGTKTLVENLEVGDSVHITDGRSGKITQINGDSATVRTKEGEETLPASSVTLLKKYYMEGTLKEQADHVAPMVAKAYKDYIKAKKDSAAGVDFAEDPEKAYRYYSKKLNNTYSTRADRDAIEAILKKKYGSALEEQDVKRDITDVKPGDIIIHDETGKRYEVQDLIGRAHRLQSNKLRVIDTEGNARVINPYKYSIQNESVNEDIQSELDKWEGRLYDLENMTKSSNNPDPIKQKKTIEGVKKKIASLKKKSEMNEIRGFEEFKETGFKLGDKVKFMGSAHPTHIKPIKLTGTIEYFEPADEIGVRVDGYGKFIPFFEIPSSIELIDQVKVDEGVESGKVYVVIPFYSDGSTINENDVRVFTSYDKADNYFNTLQGSPIIIDTSID